jgi:hypothetical protein
MMENEIMKIEREYLVTIASLKQSKNEAIKSPLSQLLSKLTPNSVCNFFFNFV